jgi:hypothetical protein
MVVSVCPLSAAGISPALRFAEQAYHPRSRGRTPLGLPHQQPGRHRGGGRKLAGEERKLRPDNYQIFLVPNNVSTQTPAGLVAIGRGCARKPYPVPRFCFIMQQPLAWRARSSRIAPYRKLSQRSEPGPAPKNATYFDYRANSGTKAAPKGMHRGGRSTPPRGTYTFVFLWHSGHLTGAFLPAAASLVWQSMQTPVFATLS